MIESASRKIRHGYSPNDLEKMGVKEVHVIVPAHNSGPRIAGVLANISNQILPPEMTLKVLVLANACSDNTAEAARKRLKRISERRDNISANVIETSVPGQANALNRLVEESGRPNVVVEWQDDVFAPLGTLACLVGAMADNPDLGAVSVSNRPIPEYRGKKASKWEKIIYLLRTKFNYSQIGFIDRLAAFRPEVIGEIPPVVSVDGYMALKSITKTGGFGVIQPEVTSVFHRVPKHLRDILKQEEMYTKATKQIFDWWRANMGELPGGEKKFFSDKIKSLLGKFQKTILDKDLSITEKTAMLMVFGYTNTLSRIKSLYKPYKSDKRSRVWSSV